MLLEKHYMNSGHNHVALHLIHSMLTQESMSARKTTVSKCIRFLSQVKVYKNSKLSCHHYYEHFQCSSGRIPLKESEIIKFTKQKEEKIQTSKICEIFFLFQ